jgi:hypothetical protein
MRTHLCEFQSRIRMRPDEVIALTSGETTFEWPASHGTRPGVPP